jgi:hypothetical protein
MSNVPVVEAQAATAAGAGVSGVVVALIGVEPAILFWAVLGCGLGVPVAPAAGRFRATLTFVMASMASALLGTLLASEYMVGATPARVALASKGAALIIGAAFHPLLSVVVGSIPSIWGGILRRLGITPEVGK